MPPMEASPLRILLTSDLHLGMRFAAYPDDLRSALSEARFACLERIVALADERRAALLVVAGDLFHSFKAARRDVERAAGILHEFSGGLAAVLPGNHDFNAPGDELWRRFREAAGDAVLLLDEARPYPLSGFGLDACLYPGPCLARHSATSALGWVKGRITDPPAGLHIGVAHGSLEGVSPDFDEQYYPMTRQELDSIGMDLWLLGHTHLPYPVRPGRSDRIFIAGTPEPDDFKCRHGGSVWLLEMTGGGHVTASLEPTGRFRFLEETAEVRSLQDLAELERGAERLGTGTLLRQRLTGKLPRADFPELSAARKRLAGALTYLDWHDEGVEEEISEAVIDQEFAEGSFPHRLLKGLAAAGDPEALQLAYEMLLEVRR